jgi:hypothetical protein
MRVWKFAAATFAGAGAVFAGARARADQFYATGVVSQHVGSPNQPAFSQQSKALGGPRGGGLSQQSLDVLNLGVGGDLTLGFDNGPVVRTITNQPGADFIIFENAFYAGGNANTSMAELIFVEVSSDGTNFARFPVESATANPVGPFGTIDPANVSGFGGVHPVFANVDTNATDPFDPAAAGGDAFDLSALSTNPLVTGGLVNLNAVRYVRLVDVLGDGSLTDRLGRPIYDATDNTEETGNGGADVDSVAVLHGLPEPGNLAMIAIGLCAIVRRRRRRR